MARPITLGERALLMTVFGPFTLPYQELTVDTNDHNRGGADNSITPFNVPYMSLAVYAPDFSGNVPEPDRAIFLHEMTHVWQYYHNYHKLAQFVWMSIWNGFDNYPSNYWYDLRDSSDFSSFNMEQQAAIVEDWWLISNKLRPRSRTDSRYNMDNWKASDYDPYLLHIRGSGPPDMPPEPEIDLNID